jgi:hypothetical protein
MKISFDEDLESLIMWCEDTLNPALAIMSLKARIREFENDIFELERLKGKSEKTQASKERFDKMLEACEYLDKISNQNISYQLIMRQNNGRLKVANNRIKELEAQLEAVNKAFNAE